VSGELQVLRRAHALFAGAAEPPAIEVAGASPAGIPGGSAGVTAAGYRQQAGTWGDWLQGARWIDAQLAGILARAYQDHREAHRDTGAVLAAARADAATVPDNPIAAREVVRRRAYRLRAQRAHLLAARRRARRRRGSLRALRYRLRARVGSGPPGRRPEVAVRAALSKLGRPYVWGATGPDRFDCSGLVQWAYAQAGVPLHRTTYEQIHDGAPVPRSQVRAGDLVFPHAGHVQLAIGGNLVVEAPHAGATVQISRMGQNVAIRRPF
jgi:cell wall-associated NlpC family hydrolase